MLNQSSFGSGRLPQTRPRCSLTGLATMTLVIFVMLGGWFPQTRSLADSPTSSSSTLQETSWRFTTKKPRAHWYEVGFDDSRWAQGVGGFGTRSTPGARVSTQWNTDDIWLRQSVELDAVPAQPAIYMHHDEDAEVYLNGKKVLAVTGYIDHHKVFPLDADAAAVIKKGSNLIAVHCHQTTGGQSIDVHLIDANHLPKLPKPKRNTIPFKSDLITKWGEQVTAENAWTEYPRPALARPRLQNPSWTNLNGHWDYAITGVDQIETPQKWDGEILVPFAIESRLSGVQRLLSDSEALWYHRTFQADVAQGERLKLNFEAVDYRCEVFVNGTSVGKHVGGSNPFSLDITDAAKSGENQLVVRVEDETEGSQIRGKQVIHAHGIWYTQVSGIWQTVWLETVAQRHIDDLKIHSAITDSPDQAKVTVKVDLAGKPVAGEKVRMSLVDGDKLISSKTFNTDGVFITDVSDAKLWSPDSPHLYDLSVAVLDASGHAIDEVQSYVGIREVGRTVDKDGHHRFTLNGETVFHLGPLDQGWWPDGLLTPPSDEGMLYDIEVLKDSGFNMIRKHIKVEPRRYYYHCDRIGMMVWQDQPSGGKGPPWTRMRANPQDADWSDADHDQYMVEIERMIDDLENHPSIVVWVPFNEAWGQHRTMEVGKWTVKRDPSRLVNIASGGNFWPIGDIADHHAYPHPNFPLADKRFDDYIKVVGEFGGHGYPVQGHLWDANRDNWGYGGLPKTLQEFKDRYIESMRRLEELKSNGIAGGVYTQTTDVEGEINGLMTYDRRVLKIPASELSKIHANLVK